MFCTSRNFFKNILNNIQDDITPNEKIAYHTADPEITEPTLDEVKTLINTLKNNKTPGEDNINKFRVNKTGG